MMLRVRECICVCALLLMAGGASVAQPHPQGARKPLRVLFIGNSFTFGNDVPGIVAALARASGERFEHESVAFPNFSLQDHWEKGEAQRAIARSKWDIVVLQQGPSALDESRAALLEYTRRFDKLIQAAGAKTALYMVWPSRARFGDFDRVAESYKLAAQEVKGILLPVGEAWREAWKLDANLALYDRDNFHASPLGSYLAALVMYKKIFARPPTRLPARLTLRSGAPEVQVAEREARVLQSAAAAANRLY